MHFWGPLACTSFVPILKPEFLNHCKNVCGFVVIQALIKSPYTEEVIQDCFIVKTTGHETGKRVCLYFGN